MKTKTYFQRMFTAVLFINILVTMTACNFFSQSVGVIKDINSLDSVKMESLLITDKMSIDEKTDIKIAINSLRNFSNSWKLMFFQFAIDESAIAKFEADYHGLMDSHKKIAALVSKHESEYTPEILAEIKTLNASLMEISERLKSVDDSAQSFTSKKALAADVLSKIPTLLQYLGALKI